jgi:hypothetical protein
MDGIAEVTHDTSEFTLFQGARVRLVVTDEGVGLVLRLVTEDLDDVRRTQGVVLLRKDAEELTRELLLGLAKLGRQGGDAIADGRHIVVPLRGELDPRFVHLCDDEDDEDY